MDKPIKKKPVVRIGKVYTKTGDKGETSLVGGIRIAKEDFPHRGCCTDSGAVGGHR